MRVTFFEVLAKMCKKQAQLPVPDIKSLYENEDMSFWLRNPDINDYVKTLGPEEHEEFLQEFLKNEPDPPQRQHKVIETEMINMGYQLGQPIILKNNTTDEIYKIISDADMGYVFVQPLEVQLKEKPGGRAYPLIDGNVPWEDIEKTFFPDAKYSTITL